MHNLKLLLSFSLFLAVYFASFTTISHQISFDNLPPHQNINPISTATNKTKCFFLFPIICSVKKFFNFIKLYPTTMLNICTCNSYFKTSNLQIVQIYDTNKCILLLIIVVYIIQFLSIYSTINRNFDPLDYHSSFNTLKP